jgi:hypothetical protein
MNMPNSIAKEFLQRFKQGDLVDVKGKYDWTGPHKLLVYKLDPSSKDRKPAAYVEIELDGTKLERWLIEGDQQVIRQHIPEEQKQRIRTKPVKRVSGQ